MGALCIPFIPDFFDDVKKDLPKFLGFGAVLILGKCKYGFRVLYTKNKITKKAFYAKQDNI